MLRGRRASGKRSAIKAGANDAAVAGYAGGFPTNPPTAFFPAGRYPFLSGWKKIPAPPTFFCKSAGDHSYTTARFSFLGRGVPGQPPRPLFFRAGGPPSLHGGGGRPGTPPPVPVLSVREGPWILAGEDYNAGGCQEWWRDFLQKGGGGLGGNPPGCAGAGRGAGIAVLGRRNTLCGNTGPPCPQPLQRVWLFPLLFPPKNCTSFRFYSAIFTFRSGPVRGFPEKWYSWTLYECCCTSFPTGNFRGEAGHSPAEKRGALLVTDNPWHGWRSGTSRRSAGTPPGTVGTPPFCRGTAGAGYTHCRDFQRSTTGPGQRFLQDTCR